MSRPISGKTIKSEFPGNSRSAASPRRPFHTCSSGKPRFDPTRARRLPSAHGRLAAMAWGELEASQKYTVGAAGSGNGGNSTSRPCRLKSRQSCHDSRSRADIICTEAMPGTTFKRPVKFFSRKGRMLKQPGSPFASTQTSPCLRLTVMKRRVASRSEPMAWVSAPSGTSSSRRRPPAKQ